MPGKLFGFCQDDDPVRLTGHIADGLGAHLVLMGETGSGGPAVHADEEAVDPEILRALTYHRTDHDLGVLLVNAAEKNDLEIRGAADIVRNESAVGDDRHTASRFRKRGGEQGTAAAALDHDGIPVPDQFRRAQGNPALFFVMVGQASLDIIRAGQNSKTVFSFDQSLGLHGVQVFADSDL